MDNVYQMQGQVSHRGTQPMTLAPTASMIDANPEIHRVSTPQMSHGFGTPQLQGQSNPPLLENHHVLHPMLDHSPDRALPSIEVTDDSFDNAYVDFIMYCNPSIPLNVDTTELRKGFRSPPKSDGKSFSPWVLYGLISRLETKDIKTWTQLVTELGVEPPDAAKNQSTQKVQQYAVRLKRWLHAFHIDAFFHYCLHMPNSYYLDRPIASEVMTEVARDGVPAEEDLALRALLPEWRPKRGRRKAEDGENESQSSKKAHRRSASADFFPNFDDQYPTNPPSAALWSGQSQQTDAWSAAQVAIAPKAANSSQTPPFNQLSAQSTGSQQIKWRLNDPENTPSTPYPQSAITPRHNFSASPSFEEPKSANPASAMSNKSPLARIRKRHGPAVSSAWSTNSTTATGKLRGRPPSNRSVQDGPFSTFPANPNTRGTPTINVSAPRSTANENLSPSQTKNDSSALSHLKHVSGISPQVMIEPPISRKPSKLQLQVPEHSGGPVRLATPPTVLINGETNRHASSFDPERRSSADFFKELDEVSEEDGADEVYEEGGAVDWKRRAMTLKKKLAEKEDELRSLKKRVLEAVV